MIERQVNLKVTIGLLRKYLYLIVREMSQVQENLLLKIIQCLVMFVMIQLGEIEKNRGCLNALNQDHHRLESKVLNFYRVGPIKKAI